MPDKFTPEIYDKIWVAHHDEKTRATHQAADGQRAPFSGTFTVGGVQLRFPGDPDGPADEVKNCRCHLRIVQRGIALENEQEIEMTLTQEQIAAALSATLTDAGPTVRIVAAATEQSDDNMYRTFTDQPIALIGSPTSDGRMLSKNIEMSYRSFPLPLMWCKQSAGGHDDAFTIGVIEDARMVGTNIVASGYLLNTPEADEAANENAHGVSNPSVDLAAAEYAYTDENGRELGEGELWDRMESGAPVVMTFTKAELIGTTLVSTPAFDTRLNLDAERSSREVAIVASAAAEFRPRVYDHRLFENPKLTGPTLPTMGEDGRIYGHLAVFGQCHRSIQTDCIMVPRSPTAYSHFHTSPSLRLDNGERLPVGRLTVGTGHADSRLRAAPALAHYDNTGSCFALVRVGEDNHGVWFSGIAAPGATADDIEQGITAPLSGDWRDMGQGLELIAALAVNTPGFAARGRDDDQGRPIALVASLGPSPKTTSRGGVVHLTRSDIKAIVSEAFEESRIRGRHAAARDAELAKARVVVPAPKSPRELIGEMIAGRA